MIRSYVRYMVALALVAAAPAAAQTGGADTARGARAQQGQRREAQPPFQRLVALRQELQLTDAQVARLQEIGRRLQERNAPLRAQLATQREQYKGQRRTQMERLSPEQRRDTLRSLREGTSRRDIPEPMRATITQMRTNIQASMQEAQNVLTPQQKERARELMKQSRAERGGRMQREGRRGREDALGQRRRRPQGGTVRQ